MTSSGADPWSGIPDDLRKLVSQVGTQWFETGYHKGQHTSWSAIKYTKYREAAEAAEAALCAALRALVADRERLQRLIVWFSVNDTFEESGVRDWETDEDARQAIDEAHFGATPRGAQEDAE